MIVDLTDEESAAIVDALGWAVKHIQFSQHNDSDKSRRVAAIKAVAISVRGKIRESQKGGRRG